MGILGSSWKGLESSEFMLRITKLAGSPSRVTLLLEGQIRSEWIAELERETNACRQAQQHVVLDFGGVSFVSPDGIEMLKRLRATGVPFVHCPAIVTDLLK